MEATQRPIRSDGLISLNAAFAFFVAIAFPILLSVAGMAGANRYAYPVLASVAAVILLARRSPWYVGLCIWLFCATPLVRRLTDLVAGWDPTNPILLTPYLASLLSSFALLPYTLKGQGKYSGIFCTMLACIGYGLLLAVFGGRVAAGLVDAMKWGFGPVFAVFLLHHAKDRAIFVQVSINAILVAAPIMGSYGIMQFVYPELWDREWVINAASLGLNSIGSPEPYELRVFSTMNSPGSFAAVMMVASILLSSRPMWISAPLILPVIMGLALSQYRAVWAATLLGIVFATIFGPGRQKRSVLAIAAVLFISAGSLATVPEINEALTKRFGTLEQLGSDASGEDRLGQYHELLNSDESLILGHGLAISGAARQLDGERAVVIDSGIIETLEAFGVIAGSIYLGGLVLIAACSLASVRGTAEHAHVCAAVVLATIIQLPFGSIHTGENGFWAWLFIGLALGKRSLSANQPATLRTD